MTERYDTIMVPHEEYLKFKKLMRDLEEFKRSQETLNVLENGIDKNINDRLMDVEDTLKQVIDIYNANVDKTAESDAYLSKALKAQNKYNKSVNRELDSLEDYVIGINEWLESVIKLVQEPIKGGESDADRPQTGR